MSGGGRRLGALAWPDGEGLRGGDRGAVLAVPVGACEQHGPHLPLDTDTRIAGALAGALAAARAEVVVAPAIAYGASGEHEAFAGTVSIGAPALRGQLVELVRSASRTFARIVFVNAHGGNVATLREVVGHQRAEGRDVRVWSADARGDAHAGRAETSLMLALAPELVRLDRAAAGATAPLGELIGRLRRDGVRAVSANGVLGDPAGASAAEGRALLERMAGELIALVEAW